MKRLARCFDRLRASGRGGLAAYVVAGDPTIEDTADVLVALAREGVDLIELGFPFSDPVGDGPEIQAASLRALRHGTTLRDAIDVVGRVRPSLGDVPVVLMGYLNPVLALGCEATVALSTVAGVDGFIVVDQPLEEAGAFAGLCAGSGLANVLIAAPTTSSERVRKMTSVSTGFLYLASGGTTGSNAIDLARTAERVVHARTLSRVPIGVGFGITTAAHVAAVTRFADLAIVGTEMVRQISAGRGAPATRARDCLRDLRRGLD